MSKKKIKKIIIKDDTEENDEDEIDDIDEEIDYIKEDDIEQDTDNAIEDEILIEDNILENDDDQYEIKSITKDYIIDKYRISANRLTKYEMVRILGERTKQLTMGAKPMIKNYHIFTYDKIAEEEFKLNMIPFKIVRPLPNGTQELWTLDELYKEHLYSQL
jgi:DNA-directed RNA polymerase subunit K/omega